MKQISKIRLLATGLSLVTGLAIFGSTAGTLAWYMYSAKTTVSFIGTSVRKSVLLHLGIVDDSGYFTDEALDTYNLSRGDPDEEDGHSIVWTSSNSGLTSTVISEYLSHSVYATNTLSPVTSKSRSISNNSALTLYESPEYGDVVADQGVAATDCYVKIPFAFKILDNSDSKLYNKEIWLTDAVCNASGQHIEQSVRVFVDNSINKFILKPADSSSSTGSTVVGGLLDLDSDGTYDYTREGQNEIPYGEFSGTPTYASTPYGIPKDTAEYDNVNNTEYESESTFYAKHNEVAHLISGVTFDKVAEYQTLGTIKPSIDAETGNFVNGKPMAYTDSSDSIGYMTLTIYIEGWDHVVVNSAINYQFNLGLKFEINRI